MWELPFSNEDIPDRFEVFEEQLKDINVDDEKIKARYRLLNLGTLIEDEDFGTKLRDLVEKHRPHLLAVLDLISLPDEKSSEN